MNNQAQINYPERTIEYLEGVKARRQGESRLACPYGMHMLLERSLFLAGWHDTDMLMTERRVA